MGVLRRSVMAYPFLWKFLCKDEGEWREALNSHKKFTKELLVPRVDADGLPLPLNGRRPDLVCYYNC